MGDFPATVFILFFFLFFFTLMFFSEKVMSGHGTDEENIVSLFDLAQCKELRSSVPNVAGSHPCSARVGHPMLVASPEVDGLANSYIPVEDQ